MISPRIFDTDVIEYVEYRRDLRHAPMETFKTKLTQKMIGTYQLSRTDHDKQSFLKSFGTFKVVKLDEASESLDKAILSMLAQMDRKISRIEHDPRKASLNAPKFDEEFVSAGFVRDVKEFVIGYAKRTSRGV
jgi:hypothetical protein